MDSNMAIDVEFLAGTSIVDAATEAKQKAIAWDVAYVKFSFNGINVSIGQGADIDYVLLQYGKKKHFIISA